MYTLNPLSIIRVVWYDHIFDIYNFFVNNAGTNGMSLMRCQEM